MGTSSIEYRSWPRRSNVACARTRNVR
jgi:hypothetical protein